MSEYYVTHSKYRSNNRKSWENALTFVPESTLKKSTKGVYNYYHNGELVWSVEDTIQLFNDFADGTAIEMGYTETKDAYPVYAKYCNDCQKFANEQLNSFKGFKINVTENGATKTVTL